MKLKEIVDMTGGAVKGCQDNEDYEIKKAFSSDLMSDVLRVEMDQTVLITGLCNIQTIRTAEMADVRIVVITRGKAADDEMVELAIDNDVTIIETPYSTFRVSGLLYNAGLEPYY